MKLSVRNSAILSLSALIWIGPLAAQQGDRLAAMMAENNKLLRQYTYKQRTEVMFKGEDRIVRINQVRFDPDGKRQLTLISETGGESKLGSHIPAIAKKREEMKDYVMRLSALVEQYFPVDPSKIQALLPNAEIAPAGNLMSIKLRNYLKKGDSISLLLDPATRKLSRVELSTVLDKDSVSMSTDMTAAPNGPNYPSLTTIKSPSKNLEIRISAYEIQKAQG